MKWNAWALTHVFNIEGFFVSDWGGRITSILPSHPLCHNSGSNPYWGVHKILLLICSCITLYVQEYVTVEIFYLALWYFQCSVTGEQSTNSMRSVFAKPNHQWTMCSLLSYSYTLKCVFSITIVQVSAHSLVKSKTMASSGCFSHFWGFQWRKWERQ